MLTGKISLKWMLSFLCNKVIWSSKHECPSEYLFFSSKMVQSRIRMDQRIDLQIARPLTLLLLLQFEVWVSLVYIKTYFYMLLCVCVCVNSHWIPFSSYLCCFYTSDMLYYFKVYQQQLLLTFQFPQKLNSYLAHNTVADWWRIIFKIWNLY